MKTLSLDYLILDETKIDESFPTANLTHYSPVLLFYTP